MDGRANEPSEHPRCNAAEVELIADGRPADDPHSREMTRVPLKEMFASPVMWCMCVTQFGTNIGWAFLITTLPTYLREAKQADDVAGSQMTSLIWLLGFFGTLLGGMLVDATTRKFGLRWGRMLPTIVTRFLGAALYWIALETSDPWTATFAFAAVSFFGDLGIPGIWAFAQDVGGKHVARYSASATCSATSARRRRRTFICGRTKRSTTITLRRASAACSATKGPFMPRWPASSSRESRPSGLMPRNRSLRGLRRKIAAKPNLPRRVS
ncbi:MAG: MFS transporter [Pirellulales bacterium]